MAALTARGRPDVANDKPFDEKKDLIPENVSLWPESMLWDKDITLRAGAGYKDNVLLSPSKPQGSAFFASGLDLAVFRIPLDGLEVNLAITADDTRFLRDVNGVQGEDLFLASARVQKYFAGHWRSGLEIKGSYVDQVIEALSDTGGVHSIVAKGYTLTARPYVRHDFGTNWWVQLEAPISREWWQFPLDDYWKLGGQLILGFDYGHRSQVSLSFGGFYIPHDEWVALDASGNQLDDTKLAVWRQIAEVKSEHNWDTARHWCSTTRATVQRDRDNGEGFFDYYRYSVTEELCFRTAAWEIRGSAGLSYSDFPVQAVTTPDSLKLYLTTLDLTLRLERRLYKTLRLFGQFEHEQTVSNDPSSEYKVNSVVGGLSWRF